MLLNNHPFVLEVSGDQIKMGYLQSSLSTPHFNVIENTGTKDPKCFPPIVRTRF